MQTLSTGAPATLGNYLKLSAAVFGLDSPATRFLQEKIDKQGPDEEVIAAESQMVYMLATLHSQPPGNYVQQKIF